MNPTGRPKGHDRSAQHEGTPVSPTAFPVDAVLDDLWLDAALLCRMAGVSQAWLHERVTLGVLQAQAPGASGDWRFDATDLRRVRRIASLERTFDAVPELAALVADLEDQLAQLRTRLQRRGSG
jgi:chaperone modulatory protein CbpM